MAKGFVRWICKLEGREVPEFEPEKDYLCFPTQGLNYPNLITVIADALEAGVGGNVLEFPDYFSNSSYHPVNDAFIWSSHPLLQHWFNLAETGLVSPEVYECCQWMDDHLYQVMIQADEAEELL